MRISFMGAGRVAHHLAHVLSQHHKIVQIYSRTLATAQTLAAQVKATATMNIEELNPEIDLVIIAVSDQAIASVISNVHQQLPNVLIVHTSGSTDIEVLAQIHARAGVFYPLQTFSLERQINWSDTPIFVEAKSEDDLVLLAELANQLSSRVYLYTSAQRLSLHLAAVFACNFSNYCYDMAKQIVDAQHVDFSLLYPLILETANKVLNNDPKQMQTGPAMRGDQNILKMHEQMLQKAQREDLKNIYQLMSQQILQSHATQS
ncbi:Rossmann-like and DUF2520 domain-containing protein [Acinetobacter bohemicus]|uniref:Rossmann-like and DUF2520 domain-containing protein n=1 Tax=Acinetobacter bohemicus TaxID=1435036 RepID=UPI00192B618C|nr:Rossmann-like and DUF2520 domain-containing protein [Acinetobacter bohemicus]CAD9196594.1 hypothetical protein QAC21B_02745 [Acinetobacter bohemicus]